VLLARQPLVLEDVSSDPRFARDTAEATGYVPQGLMAAPLLHDDRVLGVLEVLDRPENAKFSLPEMDLLAHFAHQAALALALAEGAHHARTVLDHSDPQLAELARVAEAIAQLDDSRRAHVDALLYALRALISRSRRGLGSLG